MSDRAVSTVVSYVLTLGIATLLLLTLVGVFSPIVTNQQDGSVRSNLDVFGNDLAGDLESADRLAAYAGENGTVEVRTRLPERAGGSPYEIEIEPSEGQIILRSPDYETGVTVSFTTETDIRNPGTLDGGTLQITYDTAENELVIQHV